ncbi:MAG: protease complex subunit PrcB family protein [Azospirillaceae bacterium]
MAWTIVRAGRAATLAAGLALLAGCAQQGIGSIGEAFGLDAEGETAAATPAETGSSSAPAPTAVPTIDGRRAWSGVQSAAAADLRMVARDERDWGILWQLVGEPAPGPLPDGAMALGVFLSVRPTGGHSVDIVDVAPGDEAVTVTWQETTPAPDAVVSQALSAPYTILLVRPSDAPVVFRPVSE